MTSMTAAEHAPAERGAALAIVLIFVFLILLSSFSAAVVSRTNLQVAHTIERSTEAFYAAEAGVAEAMWRLRRSSATNVSVDGKTFEARIVPDPTKPAWKTEILFDATANTSAGNTHRTPSIQPGASRIAYSSNLGGEGPLRLEWTRDASTGGIREVFGKRIVQITSLGRSGSARHQIVAYAAGGVSIPGFLVLADVPKAVELWGSGAAFPTTMQVNSSYANAIEMSSNATRITSTAPILIYGDPGCSGKCNISPPAKTQIPPLADPLSSLPEPARPPPGMPVFTASEWPNGTTIQPGYYPNGITAIASGKKGKSLNLASGLYVLGPGKRFEAKNGIATGPGVTIYADELVLAGSGEFALRAPTAGEAAGAGFFGFPYTGILYFQSRASEAQIHMDGGSDGSLDGVVYCAKCQFWLAGGTTAFNLEFVVYRLSVGGGAKLRAPSNPLLATGGGFEPLAWGHF